VRGQKTSHLLLVKRNFFEGKMLREFLDEILDFIGSESLTDEEFEALPEEVAEEYTSVTYLTLREVLENRESVSGQPKKLKLYFIAKGVDLSTANTVKTPKSNIFIGSKL
jgi:hypothetical protein